MRQLIALLLLVTLSACASGQAPVSQPGSALIGGQVETLDEGRVPKAGDPAPDFRFVLDGKTQQLSDLRGRRVLINFWATWCGPCLREMPDLNRIAQSEEDVVILGVNLKEVEAPIQEFAATHGITFPLLVDPDGLIAGRYGVVNLPTSFFIDRNGLIVERRLGAMTESFMIKRLKEIQ